MKPSPRKMLFTVLLALFFVALFAAVITLYNRADMMKDASTSDTMKLEAVGETLNDIDNSWSETEDNLVGNYVAEATIASMALRDVIKEEGDQAIAAYSSGAVIKVEGGKLTAPDGIDRTYGLTADLFIGNSGLLDAPADSSTMLAYSKITGSYYYLEWYEDTVLALKVMEKLNTDSIIQNVETAYDLYGILVTEDPDIGQYGPVLYKNSIFRNYSSLEEMGLSFDMLRDHVGETSGAIKVDKVEYRYSVGRIDVLDGYLVMLTPRSDLLSSAFMQSLFMIAAVFIILAALIVSGFSVYSYMENNSKTREMVRRYTPTRVRQAVCLCGVGGLICVALGGLLVYQLGSLYDDTKKSQERLNMLEDSLFIYIVQTQYNEMELINNYTKYASHIAELLNDHPALRNQEILGRLSETISASHITLYDAKGNETVSSSHYKGLQLSTNPLHSTTDFRRLLHGASGIVHKSEEDEATGERVVRIGVPIEDTADPDMYGAMIITLDAVAVEDDLDAGLPAVLENLDSFDTDLFIVNTDTGRIDASSNDDLLNKHYSALNLKPDDLKTDILKNIRSELGNYFVSSMPLKDSDLHQWTEDLDDLVAFFATTPSTGWRDGLTPVLAGCLIYILAYGVIAWLVIGDYNDELYKKNIHTVRYVDETQADRFGYMQALLRLDPEQRGVLLIEILVGAMIILQFLFVRFNPMSPRNTVYYYLLAGKWVKGPNLFALSAVFIVFSQIILCLLVIRLLLAACSVFMDARGRTFCRLLTSLVLYIALFAFLIISSDFIGVSRANILAAIGVFGIAVSLGAQNFVSDIISGVTFVFEGTVHVGDMVSITGVHSTVYRGEVAEIGIRFVKILDLDENVISISNRDIRVISNMTQRNSRYNCEISLSTEYPIEEIEAMLRQELPKIRQEHRYILKGPDYNGIKYFGPGTMTISITADCREEDYLNVQREVNRALQTIFIQHGYKI